MRVFLFEISPKQPPVETHHVAATIVINLSHRTTFRWNNVYYMSYTWGTNYFIIHETIKFQKSKTLQSSTLMNCYRVQLIDYTTTSYLSYLLLRGRNVQSQVVVGISASSPKTHTKMRKLSCTVLGWLVGWQMESWTNSPMFQTPNPALSRYTDCD